MKKVKIIDLGGSSSVPMDAIKFDFSPFLLYLNGENQLGYEATPYRFRIGGFKAESQETFNGMMDVLVEKAKAQGKEGIHAYKRWDDKEIHMMELYGFHKRYSDGINIDMCLVFKEAEEQEK